MSLHPAVELEVKARVPDAARVRAALEGAGATLEFRGTMVDRRLDRAAGPLGHDEVLRLRTYTPADGSVSYGVIGWKGPPSAADGYRRREEIETRVADPALALAILERVGFTVVREIARTVEFHRLGRAVLRFEWYRQMDVLLEVEGEPAAIERAIAVTGLPRAAFLPETLDYFIADYEARTGRAARVTETP